MLRIQKHFSSSATTLRTALALMVLVGAGGAALGHAGHHVAQVVNPTPEELVAYEAAKPVFERHCFRCHTTAGKKAKRKSLEHLTMDSYPFGGHHEGDAATVIRKVLGVGGQSKPSMPSDDPGAVVGDELAKVVAWADAFDGAHPRKSANTVKEKPHAH
jgi:hypothetical protein